MEWHIYPQGPRAGGGTGAQVLQKGVPPDLWTGAGQDKGQGQGYGLHNGQFLLKIGGGIGSSGRESARAGGKYRGQRPWRAAASSGLRGTPPPSRRTFRQTWAVCSRVSMRQ